MKKVSSPNHLVQELKGLILAVQSDVNPSRFDVQNKLSHLATRVAGGLDLKVYVRKEDDGYSVTLHNTGVYVDNEKQAIQWLDKAIKSLTTAKAKIS